MGPDEGRAAAELRKLDAETSKLEAESEKLEAEGAEAPTQYHYGLPETGISRIRYGNRRA